VQGAQQSQICASQCHQDATKTKTVLLLQQPLPSIAPNVAVAATPPALQTLPQPLPPVAQNAPVAVDLLAPQLKPQPQPAVAQNNTVAAASLAPQPIPLPQLAPVQSIIAAAVPSAVPLQDFAVTVQQNGAITTAPSAPQAQMALNLPGNVCPLPSAQRIVQISAPRGPPTARPLVPADFYDPVAYASNPAGFDKAYHKLAGTDLRAVPKFANGTQEGPFKKSGSFKGDWLRAVKMNTKGGGCVNEYITRYYPPGTPLFSPSGNNYEAKMKWCDALVTGPNSHVDEPRFRRLIMELVENELPQYLPHLAHQIALYKRTVMGPIGGVGVLNARPQQSPSPPTGPSHGDGSWRSKKRSEREITIIDDDSNFQGTSTAPRSAKKARQLAGMTIKTVPPSMPGLSMQNWDGTPGMTLEENFNILMNRQYQEKQMPPPHIQSQHGPTSSHIPNSTQDLILSSVDEAAGTGYSKITSSPNRLRDIARSQFRDFDDEVYSTAHAPERSISRCLSPTQVEYGQPRQLRRQSCYGRKGRNSSSSQTIWDSESLDDSSLPVAPRDYIHPDVCPSRGLMTKGVPMSTSSDGNRSTMDEFNSSLRRNMRKMSLDADDEIGDNSAHEMVRDRKRRRP
jgi:hypothetical protein